MRLCRCGRELRPGEVLCSDCRIREQRKLWAKIKWRQNSSFLDDMLSPLILRNYGGRGEVHSQES